MAPGTLAKLARLLGLLLAFGCAAAVAQRPEPERDPARARRAELAWQAGYVLHMLRDYERAIEQFRASIAILPSAEAHTFLGWSMSHLGRFQEAIEQCKIAIKLDPDFGNPYNDIGVYLVQLGRPEEAIPFLEKAIASRRYCCYHFAHTNLGRIRLAQGDLEAAKHHFERALEHEPDYPPAKEALEEVRRQRARGTRA
jgi:Tfp pilus assembly protein PilF